MDGAVGVAGGGGSGVGVGGTGVGAIDDWNTSFDAVTVPGESTAATTRAVANQGNQVVARPAPGRSLVNRAPKERRIDGNGIKLA
jgi:hypothetical protein